jgi:hypothetical protein
MKVLFLSLVLLLTSAVALQAQNTIIEEGYVYVQVATASELASLGVSINEAVAYDAAKRMRATKKYRCRLGKGGCFCNAVISADDEILSADFPEQQDWQTGDPLDQQLGVKAYYNNDLEEVIFR